MFIGANEVFPIAGDFETDEDVDRTPEPTGDVHGFEEKYPSGGLKAKWSARVTRDGRYLLDGPQTFWYRNGQRQWETTWRDGRKIGDETYWRSDGKKKWTREHKGDGSSVWTQYWPDGKKKAESTWRNFKCDGISTVWEKNGKVISRTEFADGEKVGG
jgi:antitoxin component YwqK of YwqJK toxin-antitoxin module